MLHLTLIQTGVGTIRAIHAMIRQILQVLAVTFVPQAVAKVPATPMEQMGEAMPMEQMGEAMPMEQMGEAI